MQIDYRTQAIGAGHPVDVSMASRDLIEPVSSRGARVEKARRYGPIIAIWVVLVKRFIYPVANNLMTLKLNINDNIRMYKKCNIEMYKNYTYFI